MEGLYYNSTMLTRYLLGELSQAERDRFEENFFSDSDLFIELLDAKDQLISDYLNGRLSPGDRGRFEQRFLTLPECRREVELAQLLTQPAARRHLNQQSEPSGEPPPWWQPVFHALRAHQLVAGLAAAALLVIGLFSFWWVKQPSPERAQPSVASPIQSGPAVISSTLKPGFRRSEGAMPTVKIDSGTQVVELRLETAAENYPGYRASLRKEHEPTVEFAADELRAETIEGGKQGVIVRVPASKLSVNDYQITLEGIGTDNSPTAVGTYHFWVRER